MKIPTYIIQWLYNLPKEEKSLLLELAKQDTAVMPRLLTKISRIKSAAAAGNLVLWKKIMADEEKDIGGFIHQLHDQIKITKIRKDIGLVS